MIKLSELQPNRNPYIAKAAVLKTFKKDLVDAKTKLLVSNQAKEYVKLLTQLIKSVDRDLKQIGIKG